MALTNIPLWNLTDIFNMLGMNNRIDAENANFNSLQTQSNEQKSSIEGLQSQTQGLQGQIDTHSGQISTLQGETGALSTQTSSLQAQINNINLSKVQIAVGTFLVEYKNATINLSFAPKLFIFYAKTTQVGSTMSLGIAISGSSYYTALSGQVSTPYGNVTTSLGCSFNSDNSITVNLDGTYKEYYYCAIG